MKYKITYYYKGSEIFPYVARVDLTESDFILTCASSWIEAKSDMIKKLEKISLSPCVPDTEEIEIPEYCKDCGNEITEKGCSQECSKDNQPTHEE